MTAAHRPDQARTEFLASVTSAAEARLALAGGADIIDCKDPTAGALGALPVATVTAIRAAVGTSASVSATIGDIEGPTAKVVDAARAMAATGVDNVKVGVFPETDAPATIKALGAAFPNKRPQGARGRLTIENGVITAAAPRATTGPGLIGLLFADCAPDFALIAKMAEAGFRGVMLDTAGKDAGGLPQVMPRYRLSLFVREAHRCGLIAGLAGALRVPHIATLMPLAPDVLGFRGALCRGTDRTSALDPRAVAAVRRTIDDHMGHKGPMRPSMRVRTEEVEGL